MSSPLAALSSNPVGMRMNSLLGVILPERTPAATAIDAPTSAAGLMAGAMQTVGNLAPPFEIPYQSVIEQQMRGAFGMMPNVQLVDTATASTMENLNDMALERPIALTPFSNGVHQEYREFMPLFSVRDCALRTMPGFEVVVTPVVINNVQMQLAEQSQNSALRDYTTLNAIKNLTSNEKRQRVIAMQIEHRKRGTNVAGASWGDFNFLSAIGAADVKSLGAKLSFLGPQTKEYSGTVGGASSRYFGTSGSTSRFCTSGSGGERIVNWGYHSRIKIQNMFSIHPHRGDSLFFSVGEYAPYELDHMHSGVSTAANGERLSSRKRKAPTTFVGRTSNDTLVQMRGWSSRDGLPDVFSSGWMETEEENVVERHLRRCAKQLAFEYREYEQDPLTGEMVPVNVGDGDLQDAVASVPDLIYDAFASSRYTFPVGTVKEPYQAHVSPEHLLAAHYDHAALDSLPHMDVYGNF